MQANVKEELLCTLRGMITGDIPLVEGCRLTTRFLQRMDTSITRSDAAITIAGVESETDSFPVGSDRQHWGHDALQRVDAELSEYLERVREPVLEACRSLQERLEAS